MLNTTYQIQQQTPHICLHQSTLLHRTLRQCLCLPPPTEYNNEHPTFACTNRHCYIEHFTNAYAYHHIPNTTTNTPQLLAPLDTATLNTSPMLMLTTTYQIQQRTHHICLHQLTLLHRTLRQCLRLPPHIDYNNEHPTIVCINRHCYIEYFANSYAYHHIPNTTTNTIFAYTN